MPEIMGIKDWHCVTRGQIRDTEWRPLLQRVLPLEEMRFIVGTKRITRERESEGGGKKKKKEEESERADRSSVIEERKKKVWGLLWER